MPTDGQRTQHIFTNPIFNPVPSLASANAASRTSYYAYDAADRLTTITYSSSSDKVELFYDAYGRMSAMKDKSDEVLRACRTLGVAAAGGGKKDRS